MSEPPARRRPRTGGATRAALTILVIMLSPLAGMAAQPGAALPVPLDASTLTGSAELRDRIEIFREHGSGLTFAQIRGGSALFMRPGGGRINFGYTGDTFWVRFRLRNDSPLPVRLYLEYAYPDIDYVTLYGGSPDGVWAAQTLGRQIPFAGRQVQARNPVFVLTLPPRSSPLYFLRISSAGQIDIPLVLWAPDAFHVADHARQIVYGLLFGVILIMGLYNLFIFLFTRDPSYIAYLIFIVGMSCFVAALRGLSSEYFFRDSPSLATMAMPFSIGFADFGGTLFTMLFLATKKTFPKLHPVFLAFLGASALLMFLGPFAPYRVATPAGGAFTILLALLFLVTGVVGMGRRDRAARFYIAAWIALIIGVLLTSLRSFGILGVFFATDYGMEIGAVGEVVLLSISLADRLHLAQRRAERNATELEAELARRTAAEAALRVNEEKYRQIFENAAEGIVQISEDGRILTANVSLARLYGYESPEELMRGVGNVGRELFARESDWTDAARRLREEGSLRSFEAEQRRRDGSSFTASMSLRLVTGGGGEACYEGLASDISAKRQAERLELEKKAAEAASTAKSEFLANMSHEIRTPMNAVIGFAQLLEATGLDRIQADYARKISLSARNLLRIINDVLDFSKIEAGRLSLEECEFDLDQVIGDCSAVAAARAGGKELEFVIDRGIDVPTRLIGDSLRLGQVLVNLLDNAVKFSSGGLVSLRVRCLHSQEDFADLEFSVKDSGIGLSAEQASRLFSPFTQADASITRRFGGTGLGLAISQRIVRCMGGSIEVESESGIGSRFWFRLRLARAGARDEVPAAFDFRSLRVLVVEDNEEVRAVLRSMASSFFDRVETAATGSEALAAFRAGPGFDLVLLDYRLPDMDGIETMLRLRSQNPKAGTTRFLIMSAYGSPGLIDEARRSGAADFLIKPVTHSALCDSVMAVFGQMRTSRSGERAERSPGAAFSAGMRHESPLRGSRILVVEDNELNREIVLGMLEPLGCETEVAATGREAVERAAKRRFDLILMDLQMPVMGGLEAAGLIRSGGPSAASPIVAMTADVLPAVVERCAEVGMNGHLGKPFRKEELLEVLERWVGFTSASPDDASGAGVGSPGLSGTGGMSRGIDLESALGFFEGRRDELARIMASFRDRYLGRSEDIDALRERGEADALFRLGHALKGLAANIGATPLAEASQRFEGICRDRLPTKEETDAFIAELDRAVEAADSHLGDLLASGAAASGAAGSGAVAPPGGSPGPSLYEMGRSLRSLRALVENGSAASAKALYAFERACGTANDDAPGFEAEVVDRLRTALRKFDFQSALPLIATLEAKLAAVASDPDIPTP
ncbi:MAG TPA: response regulator [Rectinemataceae bacterium]|nr:response regulator [Rectinemataceae bacterium]